MADPRPEIDRIRLLLLDVDGVLTDGGIIYDNNGCETKRFHVHDGAAIGWWKRAGHEVAILSGRTSEAVRHRADELGIEHVIQGARTKIPPFEKLLRTLEIDRSEVCFVGDDLPDLPVLQQVGYAASPANARTEVRESVAFVSESKGGRGAVREIVEHLLKAQGRWSDIVERYRE